MKISEYDAFGPWIYKIDEDHEIPRFFRNYVDENDGALFRLKVPKKIERREATADMDLYEYLLNVYTDRLEVMKIEEHGIQLQKVPFNKVCAVTLFRDLLLGRLTVYLGDDIFTFEYNAVSQDLILEVVACIRKGYQTEELLQDNTAYDPSHLNLNDLFFVNEWVRLEPSERPFIHCAYQPMHELTNAAITELSGSLHVKKAQEWIILQKLEAFAYEYIYLPRKASTSIRTSVESPYPDVVELDIVSGNFSAEVIYDASNKDIDSHYRD